MNHTKIMYGLIAVLFIALGFTLYQNHELQMSPHSSGATGQSLVAGNATSSDPLAGITVGSAPVTSNVSGIITQINGNSMQIKDSTTGGTDSISITADTKVQIDGALKDQGTLQKELAAYNVQVAMLMKDPVANKAALAALKVPTGQSVTDGTIANLAVGDDVMVAASSVTSSDVYVASLISKSTAQ